MSNRRGADLRQTVGPAVVEYIQSLPADGISDDYAERLLAAADVLDAVDVAPREGDLT